MIASDYHNRTEVISRIPSENHTGCEYRVGTIPRCVLAAPQGQKMETEFKRRACLRSECELKARFGVGSELKTRYLPCIRRLSHGMFSNIVRCKSGAGFRVNLKFETQYFRSRSQFINDPIIWKTKENKLFKGIEFTFKTVTNPCKQSIFLAF